MTKNALLERGPKHSGMGRPPPPIIRAMPERKRFFSVDPFPKECKDARYDKCQPISTIIWTLIKKKCGRLPDIPSWSRTFHVGSVPIVSKSIASSNSPKSSFPLTIVNTEFPYVVKT